MDDNKPKDTLFQLKVVSYGIKRDAHMFEDHEGKKIAGGDTHAYLVIDIAGDYRKISVPADFLQAVVAQVAKAQKVEPDPATEKFIGILKEQVKALKDEEIKVTLGTYAEVLQQTGVATTAGINAAYLRDNPHAGAPGPIKENGQHSSYWILSADERAKGFIRPVRTTYRHVGTRPKGPTRPLTVEEEERYSTCGYVCFEPYEGEGSVTGRFWTTKQLTSGCQMTTTMSDSIAETYARKPDFYGSTFCVACRAHAPVGEHGEFIWVGTQERVGT